MQYVVHGVDKPSVGHRLDALAKEHWAYMDRYAERLVARGPTLSDDGVTHTGSVHVIEATSLDEARGFAFQEPFSRAGLYASVSVTRFQNALDATMWDRPLPPPGWTSTLVLVTWSTGQPMAVMERAGTTWAMAELDRLVFGGLLISQDAATCTGLVAALDLAAQDAASLLAGVGPSGTVRSTVTHRWQRGGRNQP
jgi:uncharacterized protein